MKLSRLSGLKLKITIQILVPWGRAWESPFSGQTLTILTLLIHVELKECEMGLHTVYVLSWQTSTHFSLLFPSGTAGYQMMRCTWVPTMLRNFLDVGPLQSQSQVSMSVNLLQEADDVCVLLYVHKVAMVVPTRTHSSHWAAKQLPLAGKGPISHHDHVILQGQSWRTQGPKFGFWSGSVGVYASMCACVCIFVVYVCLSPWVFLGCVCVCV